MNSTQSLRRRLNSLADSMVFVLNHSKTTCHIDMGNAADLRAILSAHREAKRELAACKKALRNVSMIGTTACDILAKGKVKI